MLGTWQPSPLQHGESIATLDVIKTSTVHNNTDLKEPTSATCLLFRLIVYRTCLCNDLGSDDVDKIKYHKSQHISDILQITMYIVSRFVSLCVLMLDWLFLLILKSIKRDLSD